MLQLGDDVAADRIRRGPAQATDGDIEASLRIEARACSVST